jgi:hypothetical protein
MPNENLEGVAGLWLLHGAMQDRRQFLPLLVQLRERLPVLLSDLASHGQRRELWRHLEHLNPAARRPTCSSVWPVPTRSNNAWWLQASSTSSTSGPFSSIW